MNIFERNVKKVVILAVVAAAFSSIFVKLTSAPAMAIGFYRLAFALPVFAIMTLVKHKDEVLAMTRKQLGGCAVAGMCLAGHFFSWFTGVEHTSVASATVLAMTDPFMILLISVFIFKEKTNKKAVAGVIVAFIGSIIISGSDYSISKDVLFGDIMCLFAALFIGLYFIAGNKFRKGINASVYVFFVFLFCWITFTIGMIVTGTPFTGYSTNDMFWIFVMAMVCQIGAHAVFNWCLGYTSALYIATCENLETFIATGLAVVLFAEIPSLWQIIGGLTIVAGVTYYTRHEGDSNGL
ncbi:DMT family transporter [Aminipila terrae]|uniref:EamA family transporter n=1 Tax=Aminipila terrae TaxID=2697030 RepID=A0A6P1MH02_9FIRM|nr:DMT family transporter [Aminipila terrae]QHI72463.1 EamA family transporter [Aminipila terrae]